MDIDKLEKLSCLKISPDLRESVTKSLEGVFKMMSSLNSIEVEKPMNIHTKNTDLEKDQFENTAMVSGTVEGLHLTDGYFLAPKVIKKD